MRAGKLPPALGLVLWAGMLAAAEPPERLLLHPEPLPVTEVRFQNGAGEKLTFDDFRGKVLVVNIWATWCPPCREEMPTLDRLQGELGGKRFEVIALSIDRAGPRVVREFYREIGIEHLALYIDPTMQVTWKLGAPGIPTTLVLDAEGREIGRLVGKADWATPEMLAYFRDLIAEQTGGETS